MQNVELDALPVYDDRYIKIKIETYGDKVYTSFRGFNGLDHIVDFESFTAISINSLLVSYSKCYLQVYLDNCAYKIVDRQMTDYHDGNLLETDKD